MSAPTPFEVVTIPLGGSQDDKTARLTRAPGVLRHVYDAVHDHVGEVGKRAGFTRIPLNEELYGVSPESLFIGLGLYEDTPVLIGSRGLYAIAAADDVVDGNALVYRGPSMIGNYRTGLVHVSTIGRDS